MKAIIALLAALAIAGCSEPPWRSPEANHGGGTMGADALLPAVGGNATIQPSGQTLIAMAPATNGQVTASNRTDITWGKSSGGIYVKGGTSFHYNLNQPAKPSDALMDEWSLVFAPDAPFRASDRLYFCGPLATVVIQVYAAGPDEILYSGSVSGVPPC